MKQYVKWTYSNCSYVYGLFLSEIYRARARTHHDFIEDKHAS